jgi:hypothetical protein
MEERDIRDVALEIVRHVHEQPDAKSRLATFKADVAKLNGQHRSAVLTLITLNEELVMATVGPQQRRDRLGLAIAGAVFLLLLMGIAIFIPSPTCFQERVFAVVLAISGAAAVAFLPGAIAIEAAWAQNLVVRAVGAVAFAVFVLSFYSRILGSPTPCG